MRIVAILLAAGEGRRLGGPKALLPLRGGSFISEGARLLTRTHVAHVVVVLGCAAETVAARGGLPPEVLRVENPAWRDGMLGSALCGLAEAERLGADAILLHLVDHPLVQPETVDRVIEALRLGATIAVPSFEGRRGHPAGFAAAAFRWLRAAPPEQGLRTVLARHPEAVTHVVGDAGCLQGIDTLADYKRLVGPLPPNWSAVP